MTEISTLKMALTEASRTSELTGCKVSQVILLVQCLKSGQEYRSFLSYIISLFHNEFLRETFHLKFFLHENETVGGHSFIVN